MTLSLDTDHPHNAERWESADCALSATHPILLDELLGEGVIATA
jgi:alpha-D-ribose 1-methylphosphonate 5-phosphate C-P lyase